MAGHSTQTEMDGSSVIFSWVKNSLCTITMANYQAGPGDGSNLVISHIIGEQKTHGPMAPMQIYSDFRSNQVSNLQPILPYFAHPRASEWANNAHLPPFLFMANLIHSGKTSSSQPGKLHVTVTYHTHFKLKPAPSARWNRSGRKAAARPGSELLQQLPQTRCGRRRKWGHSQRTQMFKHTTVMMV